MIVDDDVLEKEDMYILNRMKEFISNEEVLRLPAAKQLNILIERYVRYPYRSLCIFLSCLQQRGGDAMIKMVVKTSQGAPPPPILPKNSKKIKLLDIDSLELARQITIIESRLYQKIKPMECLQRSREQREGDHNDSITAVIQMANHVRILFLEAFSFSFSEHAFFFRWHIGSQTVYWNERTRDVVPMLSSNSSALQM
jgi:son of sevenless-like protein